MTHFPCLCFEFAYCSKHLSISNDKHSVIGGQNTNSASIRQVKGIQLKEL